MFFAIKDLIVSSRNQEAVEASFSDIMVTLTEAPVSSPLSKIDRFKMGEFLVHLTQASKLGAKKEDLEVFSNSFSAVSFCFSLVFWKSVSQIS